MKMLEHYIRSQQDKLETMQARQHRLLQTQFVEQERYDALSLHMAGLGGAQTMSSALGLQNLTNVRAQMLSLCQQQQEKVQQAQIEHLKQQQACQHQAKYNIGLTQLHSKQRQRQQLKQQRVEQKQMDEIAAVCHRLVNG